MEHGENTEKIPALQNENKISSAIVLGEEGILLKIQQKHHWPHV